jgi:hypothetical protein
METRLVRVRPSEIIHRRERHPLCVLVVAQGLAGRKAVSLDTS